MDGIQRAKAAADAAHRQQHYELAIQKYGESIQASEDSLIPDLLHVLYSNRSAAKLAIKDYRGALADAQAAVAVNDKWLKGWYRTAKALQGLGDYPRAVQAATKTLELDPGNTEVQALLQVLSKELKSGANDPQLPATRCAQQQQQQQRLSWQQLCALRSSLNLRLLPQQLVAGSQYIPSADGVNANLLLLLHGLGDKPAPFTALARKMQLPQTASLALSGPLPVPDTAGGRAWFEAFEADGQLIQPTAGETRRMQSLAAAVDLLQLQLLPALAAVGGWQPEQVQLLGFSQGGTVALELARHCRGALKLGGVVAVSASLLEESLAASSTTGSTACEGGTAVLLTHGDRDDVVPRSLVTRTVEQLCAEGCDVTLHTLPQKAHGMINSADEMRACMAFWAARLRNRPAAADNSYVEVPKAAAAAVLREL